MDVPDSIWEKAWWYAKRALTVPYMQRTYSHDTVPKLFQEPFIYGGFRPLNKPWSYYFASLFQIHNDTGNVWSHLLAVFIYIYATGWYFQELDYRDSATWGIAVFACSIITYALFSSVAHLLHAKSALAHYVFFSLDYVGIGVYGYGMGTMLYYCSGTELFYESLLGKIYIYVNFLLNINLYVMLILAKLCYCNQDSMIRKAMFMGSSLSSQVFMATPLLFRWYESVTHSNPGALCDWALLGNHCIYCALLVVTAFFFASFLPERGCPGGYDIVGHSHQIFHILCVVMSLFQLKAGYADLTSQPAEVLVKLRPSFMSTFGGFILTLCSGLLLIFLLRNRMRQAANKKHAD